MYGMKKTQFNCQSAMSHHFLPNCSFGGFALPMPAGLSYCQPKDTLASVAAEMSEPTNSGIESACPKDCTSLQYEMDVSSANLDLKAMKKMFESKFFPTMSELDVE
jgi:hypothetical protein